MVKDDQLNVIKDMVFNREIGQFQGIILAEMYKNSRCDYLYYGGRVCEISSKDLAKKLKIPLPNLGYHIRVLEKLGLLTQMYCFADGGGLDVISGYKSALKYGIMKCRHSFFSLDIPGDSE